MYNPGQSQPPPVGFQQELSPGPFNPQAQGYQPVYNPTTQQSVAMQMQPMSSGYASDPEDPTGGAEVSGFEFNDQSVRKAFIRKVYSILMVQLLITFGAITLFAFHKPTGEFVAAHQELFWIALAVMIVTLISMACCTNVRRKAPMNFIFLALFTIAESFLLGCVSATYQSEEVMWAVGITAGVCLALTIFAFQTKWDFTMIGGALTIVLFLLIIFGIVAIFFPGKTLTLIYASLGVIVFSLYLIYDTQLMMGGKHKYSISPEEYIFAALNLYLDIVNIFLYILTIIGASKN